jgi:nonsense-mediated mRNA decay protein 3
VKKSYEERRARKRGKPRPWKLKALDMEIDPTALRQDQDKRADEYEKFLEEIEEDPELRAKIALYRDETYRAQSETASMLDGEGDEPPSVPLEELLADLRLEGQSNRDESEAAGEEEDEEMEED